MPNCKYIKQQEIVSYNGGEDWQDVMPAQYRKGQLIEHGSEDCSEIDTLYRWRKLSGVYLCVDDTKYEKLILDESYDGGLSWYPAYPSQYTTGNSIGVDEDYCNDKFVGHYYMTVTSSGGGTIGHGCTSGTYWDGHKCARFSGGGSKVQLVIDPIKIVKCDGNPELTSADTKYYTSYPSNYKFSLLSAEIGKCVTSIAASAFTNSSALTYVSMADSVTSIGARAFYDCRSLSGMNTTIPGELNIPSGVTSIGNYAFYQCSGITSIICNSTTPPSLGGSNVFYGTNNCPIYVPCGSIGSYQYSWSSLASRIAPIGGTVCDSVRVRYYYNGESLTYYCGNITSVSSTDTNGTGVARSTITGVSIGDCVTTIGATSLSGCSFTSILIPSGVTSIGNSAFYNCTSLTSVTIPDSVISIGDGAFGSCSGLTNCTIGSGVTSIDEYAFYRCSGLTSITINATTPPTLGLNALTSTNTCPIYVPCSSRSTYQAASGWSDYASRIYGIPPCETIYKIVTRNGDDSQSIECNSSSILTKAEVSDVVFSYAYSAVIGSCVTEIAASAFTGGYNAKVTSVTIPDSVTTIGASAFYNCKLTYVTIPSSVTSIGYQAFKYCTGLTGVTVEATTPPTLGSNAFNNTNSCPIYVPSGSVNAYKSASEWSNYSSRIQAIT